MVKISKIVFIAVAFVVICWFLFTFIIGYDSMGQYNTRLCLNQTNSELERLKTEIEASDFENPQTFSIEYPCWKKSAQSILLKTETEPIKCAEFCGHTTPSCALLDYKNLANSFTTRTCIDIPTEFVDNITINAN